MITVGHLFVYSLKNVRKYPKFLSFNNFLSKYKFESSQDVSGVNAQEWHADKFNCPTPCPVESKHIGSEEQSVDLKIALVIILFKFGKSLQRLESPPK